MQPQPVRRPPEKPSSFFVLTTAAVLVGVFVLVVLLFFVFSAATPSLMGKCVAVVDINNEIMLDGTPPSLFSTGTPGSEDIANSIRGIEKREDVGAVVFIINTPGGSAVGTREIYEAVRNVTKPKISYFREMAASGGYYIGSGTDYIVSEPGALTGNIGAIATLTDMSGLLEKVGVNITSYKSGAHKDIGSPYREMTPEETAIFQSIVMEEYADFRNTVLANRAGRIDITKFNAIDDGRILSGRQAQRIGLVDAVGNKRDAVMKAADLAKIPYGTYEDIKHCRISSTPEPSTIFSASTFLRQIGFMSGDGWKLQFK